MDACGRRDLLKEVRGDLHPSKAITHAKRDRSTKKNVVGFRRNQRAMSAAGSATVKAPMTLDTVTTTTRLSVIDAESISYINGRSAQTTLLRCARVRRRNLIREASQIDEPLFSRSAGTGPVATIRLRILSALWMVRAVVSLAWGFAMATSESIPSSHWYASWFRYSPISLFAAGFISVLVFQQGAQAILNAVGFIPNAPFSASRTWPLGAPQI
jgi:hypothetical protein